MNQVVDEELLKRFAEGDANAFKLLYSRHKGGLYRYFLRQLHDQQLAEDLFQDTWGKVIANADSFEPNAKFSTWLYKMARNRIIDQVRHLQVVSNVISDAEHDSDFENTPNQGLQNTPENLLQTEKQKMLLKECMQSLPVKLLEAFLLKEESTMSVKQIAEVIDLSYEATKSRLRYSYAHLKTCLTKKMPDWAISGANNG